jgi:hypothetical protein
MKTVPIEKAPPELLDENKLAERLDEALERLRSAESMIGTPHTNMFMDAAAPEHRLRWLRETRALLKVNGVEPENLDGPWHTEDKAKRGAT